MKTDKNYYLTTAIAYTSAKPHIGNIYEIVLADSIARFKRAQGYNVRFQTGTDEHGQKIEDYAKRSNRTPKEHVDEISTVIRDLFDLMNVSYDKFIRTTDAYHMEQVQKIFKKFKDQGDIYLGKYSGYYCQSCESYFTETQAPDKICPDCGGPLTVQEEACYFFKLSNYQDRLVEHIKTHPNFIQPESRKNEMLQNFLKEPLLDLAVSRTSFKWGIPVDFDPEHVVYVWLDALVNYITGLGFDVDGNHGPLYDEFWPADVHLIGKDILRFHTIYWPIFLMALKEPLPKQVFGHPWLLVGEGKMSKSKGNVIYADDLVEVFGVDPVRYIMLHEMPFERDGTITHELMIERINTDFANIIGNCVHRTLNMTNKYFDGVIPTNHTPDTLDEALIEMASTLQSKVVEHMDTLHVADSINDIVALFRRCNKYIDETAPWTLAKDEETQDRLATVLYNLLESIRIGAILLEPFIPDTAQNILNQLQTEHTSFESSGHFGLFELNKPVTKTPVAILQRLDLEETMAKFEKQNEPELPKAEPEQPEVTIDDFMKLDFRTGVVIEGEKHPKADKLYVLKIDLGYKVVQVVSGLVGYYSLEELIGQHVVVVVNLKPAKLRGVESQGMVLAAEDEHTLRLVNVQGIAHGTRIR
ncbi:methionine--tRNA ligase [Erysipelothrix larvae]|uniref:Methionine--tRNA ligase n=1 Tax=Erysipelothrix larvae TaxID=1514105 RepID=A0A0X8H1W1_9FIRM|nr:methionine--tRNA ligase [Erysipelothrix larvae]AMC94555.1 methionine--tRNA ligase [Erysipelothrix larvae]